MFNINEPLPTIVLTVKDLMALDTLLTIKPSPHDDRNDYIAEYLQRELNRAEVVAEQDIPDHIVRMYSTVTYSTNMFGEERSLTLVYPKEANIDAGKVSIMTPIGAALIGMAAGNRITYYTASGGTQTLTVISVKPPANGNSQTR